MNKVLIKLQRPLAGSMNEVMSYIVDNSLAQISDPVMSEMSDEDIDYIFDNYYKVYYWGQYKKGKPVTLLGLATEYMNEFQ